MSRRLDVELTSSRDDGTWTWRAAGAKQPKGVVENAVVPSGAKVGDVLRVEADFEIDGINITAVIPGKGPRTERERIQILAAPEPSDEELVTSTLVPKSDRPRGPRRDRLDFGDRPSGPRRDARPSGPQRRPESGGRPPGDRSPGRDGAAAGPRREGGPGSTGRPAGPRRDGGTGERGPRRDGAASGPRRDGATSGPRREGGTGPRPDRARPPRPEGGERPSRPPQRERAEAAAPPKPKAKRLNPGNTHRSAVLESLAPEERAVAEHVLRGGLPAVRQAIEAQNADRPEGQPVVQPEALLGLAEKLMPRLKTAEWRDRAEAAAQDADEISLRDLRAVVTGADAAARDDDTRLLASTLRQALDRRLQAQRDGWHQEVTKSLDDQRLVRALRISSRPPDPGTRLPADLAVRLTEATNAAMAPETSPERWSALLEAVAASPVRRTVKPGGLPAEPGEPLLQMARQTAGRVPAMAALLGIDMPPPPGPRRLPPRPPRPPRPARPGPSATAPVPAAAPAAESTPAESAPVVEAATPEAAAPGAAVPEAPVQEAAAPADPAPVAEVAEVAPPPPASPEEPTPS